MELERKVAIVTGAASSGVTGWAVAGFRGAAIKDLLEIWIIP